CGYDLALLELAPNATGFPSQWVAPSFLPPRRGLIYESIGFGCQDVVGPDGFCGALGVRMQLTNVKILANETMNTYVQGRVCEGDSGGPLFMRAEKMVYGALSRGDEACTEGIYTRLDAHAEWLRKYGALAAQNAGSTSFAFATPSWVTD